MANRKKNREAFINDKYAIYEKEIAKYENKGYNMTKLNKAQFARAYDMETYVARQTLKDKKSNIVRQVVKQSIEVNLKEQATIGKYFVKELGIQEVKDLYKKERSYKKVGAAIANQMDRRKLFIVLYESAKSLYGEDNAYSSARAGYNSVFG